ncbi:uncharacterized protein BO97DRAFT_49392 [Aspergillus homomorphus CBS 101889]|uniref:Uncharacterized protein n=1 Tax=Aspergillus homomorphus (strain CBS 101889) TaxID=1450537 RepID=A0A395I385_ASPHC|nr:hypothetical protein BO97DRAFT_49392 [Aspergillus homomorphus CBS 101889]RAL12964.1 hypothetical protein BO97DRAFT_49392 [Aspergillus homomorphus CBS 101889]
MSHDRVIQDSDAEDDPFVAPRSPGQEADNVHADVQNHQEQEGNYDSSMNINFDQYLQSQERSQPGIRFQHQQEDRWNSTNAGGGPMGSMMNEIGLAQQRLFDDDEAHVVDTSRQHHHEGVYSESIQAVTTIPVQAEQVTVDLTGHPYTSNSSSYSALDSNLGWAQADPSLSLNTNPNPSSLNRTPPPQQYEAPRSDDPNEYATYAHVEVPIQPYYQQFSSIPSHNLSSAARTSSSFNVFEASLPPLENAYPDTTDNQHNITYSATTIPTEVAPTSSPRRIASLQATPFSPHDTQPFSSVPSAAKASRYKSDSHLDTPTSHPSYNGKATATSLAPTQLSADELVAIQVPAAQTPTVEKKRGRKKKQQPPEPQAPSLPEPDNPTESEAIVIDDKRVSDLAEPTTTTTTINSTDIQDPNPTTTTTTTTTSTTEPPNNKPEKRKPGRPPKNPKPPTTDPEDPSNIEPPHQQTDLPPNQQDEKTQPSGTKEPKKKKLKRGKTTSITLTKTYESDIEPDVIWVEEEEKENYGKRAGRGPAIELSPPPSATLSLKQHPDPEILEAKENFDPSTTAAAAAAATTAEPAPKKRGRKRKNPPPTEQEREHEHEQQKQVEQVEQEQNPAEPTTEPGGDEGEDDLVRPPNQAEPTPDPQPNPELNTVPTTPLKSNKGPTKHSPISSTSKVPYRVGLSRRARIAPLLKVVKR